MSSNSCNIFLLKSKSLSPVCLYKTKMQDVEKRYCLHFVDVCSNNCPILNWRLITENSICNAHFHRIKPKKVQINLWPHKISIKKNRKKNSTCKKLLHVHVLFGSFCIHPSVTEEQSFSLSKSMYLSLNSRKKINKHALSKLYFYLIIYK